MRTDSRNHGSAWLRGLAWLALGLSALVCEAREAAESQAARPNILWLVIEDMGPYLSMYGDSTVETPNLSRLAREGITYTNVYSTSGVCAPSRAALALGMYPSSVGANHMRTSSHTEATGLPRYEAVPPPEARMLSHYLREAGYYATNNYKTDYQFKEPRNAWDENSVYAHWRHRPAGQPFFSVVNFTTTHESGLFEPYGIRRIESRHYFADDAARVAALPQGPLEKTSEAEAPVHLPYDADFPIPPYLPDTELARRDFWKMYNNLVETDRQIGATLAQLEQDGLLGSTIIVFYSDHGGPLPRQKRLIYDSGLRVPMIIRFPDGRLAGTTDDQLISFVDFAPTTLEMAACPIPTHLQGRSFLGQGAKREYIHAAADRFDEKTDALRAVKDQRFKYIRNYRPQQPYYLPLAYRERIPMMQELLRLRDSGELTEAQALWFRSSKPREELFDTLSDPHELRNLADDPAYAAKLAELSGELDRWLAAIGDQPELAEADLIQQLWGGRDAQPRTANPSVAIDSGIATIECPTEGATIGYKLIDRGYKPVSWTIYQGPFELPKGMRLQAFAHRIGYAESEILDLAR